MNKAYVYIQEKDDGSYYIGKCESGKKSYVGSGVRFRNSYDKDPSRWTKRIIKDNLTPEEACSLEAELVTEETLKDPLCFNLITGGGSGTRGLVHSEKVKNILSEVHSTRERGPHSEETKLKMSLSQRGSLNHNFGKKASEETLKKMSEVKEGFGNPNAKTADIYCYKTDALIAENVCISEWAKKNGYNQGKLSQTANCDRTQPSSDRNRRHHKRIYAVYKEGVVS